MAEHHLTNPDSQRKYYVAQYISELIIATSKTPIEKIILSGSTARNEARQDSDIDMVVIFKDDMGFNTIAFYGGKISNILQENGFSTGVHAPNGIDFTFLSRAQTENLNNFPEYMKDVVKNLLNDGITLYPPVE